MFVDYTILELWGGNGGKGAVSFRREKFEPKGGPDGGDGGNGGHCIIKVDTNLRTLSDIRYRSIYKAKNGHPGGKNNKFGKNGENQIVLVPSGCIVKDKENNVLADLIEENEEFVVCKGGKGGKGNSHFKTSRNQSPRKAQPGKIGEKGTFIIELKLLADVGLVGLPNSGKSTLLSVLTNANPKIGNYPFTTIEPNLGLVKYGEYKSFVVADIPGLIEGAGSGKGLGYQFLKHIERTRVLIFLVDINDENPNSTYEILLKEIKEYNVDILKKSKIKVLSKADTLSQKQRIKNSNFQIISSVSGEGLQNLIHLIELTLNEEN
jgi:GTP-binding protein